MFIKVSTEYIIRQAKTNSSKKQGHTSVKTAKHRMIPIKNGPCIFQMDTKKRMWRERYVKQPSNVHYAKAHMEIWVQCNGMRKKCIEKVVPTWKLFVKETKGKQKKKKKPRHQHVAQKGKEPIHSDWTATIKKVTPVSVNPKERRKVPISYMHPWIPLQW